MQSPYFKSGNFTEDYDVVVMRSKIDGSISFAINEFPVMDELAVEQFWIEKVKEKRRQREEVFRKLEVEAVLREEAQISAST